MVQQNRALDVKLTCWGLNPHLAVCFWATLIAIKGYPCGLVVKNLPANARDARDGFDPWVGKIPWRRKWQPAPVFLPGGSHGQRSLVDYSPWGHQESDITEKWEHTCYNKMGKLLSTSKMIERVKWVPRYKHSLNESEIISLHLYSQRNWLSVVSGEDISTGIG